MRSDFAIDATYSNRHLTEDGYDRSVSVDTRKAHYKGRTWTALSNHDKRKLENLIILSEPKLRTKVIYHP